MEQVAQSGRQYVGSRPYTPLIRLAAARRAYEAAVEACPHWDFDGATGEHKCCVALAEAELELRAARKAVRYANGAVSDLRQAIMGGAR